MSGTTSLFVSVENVEIPTTVEVTHIIRRFNTGGYAIDTPDDVKWDLDNDNPWIFTVLVQDAKGTLSIVNSLICNSEGAAYEYANTAITNKITDHDNKVIGYASDELAVTNDVYLNGVRDGQFFLAFMPKKLVSELTHAQYIIEQAKESQVVYDNFQAVSIHG
jgi:hypothetical protein